MKPILAVLLCFLAVPCRAQPVVLDAAQDRYVLDAAIDLLEDPARALRIDDVAASRAFVRNAGGVPNRGYSNAAYWVRFTLRNEAPDRSWLLVLDNPNVSLVDVLLADTAGTRLVYQSGTRKPFHQRLVTHPSFVVPLDLPAGREATMYLHLIFEEPVRIPLRIWSAEAFFAQDRSVQFVVGAFYGILAIMAVYHLFLFVSIRDRSYLYFVLFVASLGLLQFGGDGLSYAYLWPEAIDWNQQSHGLLNGLTMLLSLLFAGRFLDTGRLVPRLDRWIRGLAVLAGLLVLLKLLIFLENATAWPEAYSRLTVFLALAAALLVYANRARLPVAWRYDPAPFLGVPLVFGGIVLGLAYFAGSHVPTFDRAVNTVVTLGSLVAIGVAAVWTGRQGFRPAWLFLAGVGGMLLGGLVDVLTHVGLLPYVPVTQWSEETGIVTALGLLSLSLGDRINLLRSRAAEAEGRAQQAQRRATEARFEALQAKINPHFLFNILNAIAGLIRLDPVRAERAVEKLARLFRYTLHRSGQGLVPLPDELAMVRAYLELEQIRLDERLAYTIHTEGDLSRVRVPALLIQPLVENSVKYAVAARAAGGRIDVEVRVEADRCRIVVRDDGPGWSAAPTESGYGLASIRGRLALTYGTAFELYIHEAQGVVVEMVLPCGEASPTNEPAAAGRDHAAAWRAG